MAVGASDLWGFCARRVSDARLRRAVTRAERVRPLDWHKAPACPPHVWANRYRSTKQQAHRTPANARFAPFANPRTPFTARIRRAPSSRYRLEIATAPATFARPGAQPSAGRPRAAPGGYKLGAPDAHQRARNPATLPLASPRRIASTPPQSGAHGHVTAQKLPQRQPRSPDPWPRPLHGVRTLPLGATSLRDLGASDAHTTPPRSRSRAPASSRPPRLSQGPIVASPPKNCQSASRFHQTRCPALGTRPQPVGVPSSRDLEAPVAHQCARTL